ncbi:hypothetical protein RHMOL_Rhmol04G0253000 [Rhododendron molle]|uniref:Uncharacterized protein n=1 Tax=Rhododendron molle TaxID=49168 RepID=A0ACC0P425_RHOML|nr:hypothetical protein RHMOL_Rhmol04G0253000 [Rhododendron molle]
MTLRRPLNSRAFSVLLFSSILLSWFPGSIMSATVTLDSIKIFNSHEWIPTKPTVYFQCKGENKTYLPDVKDTHVSYTFKGEESWQVIEPYDLKRAELQNIFKLSSSQRCAARADLEICKPSLNIAKLNLARLVCHPSCNTRFIHLMIYPLFLDL